MYVDKKTGLKLARLCHLTLVVAAEGACRRVSPLEQVETRQHLYSVGFRGSIFGSGR